MSHQVNYFLTLSDFQALFERIKKAGPVLILSCESPSSSPLVVQERDLMGDPKTLFFKLVRPEDLPLVITEHMIFPRFRGQPSNDIRPFPLISRSISLMASVDTFDLPLN